MTVVHLQLTTNLKVAEVVEASLQGAEEEGEEVWPQQQQLWEAEGPHSSEVYLLVVCPSSNQPTII